MFILSAPFYNLYSFHSFHIFYSSVEYLPSFTTFSMCLYYAYSTFFLNTKYKNKLNIPIAHGILSTLPPTNLKPYFLRENATTNGNPDLEHATKNIKINVKLSGTIKTPSHHPTCFPRTGSYLLINSKKFYKVTFIRILDDLYKAGSVSSKTSLIQVTVLKLVSKFFFLS